jgi:hypothetical protein
MGNKKPAKKVKAAKKPEIKIESIPARHDFTEQEMSGLGSKLAGLTQEKSRVEEEKKVAMSQWTTRIKAIQNDIAATSGKISSGFEMRDTECEVTFDWKKGEKSYTRKADGKHLETRKIEEHERQQKLFEEEKEKQANAPKPLQKGDNIVSVEEAIKQAETPVNSNSEEDADY